jgi:hypothetical protein
MTVFIEKIVGDLMLEDLADLFEQAAADGTPVRTGVGGDAADGRTGS